MTEVEPLSVEKRLVKWLKYWTVSLEVKDFSRGAHRPNYRVPFGGNIKSSIPGDLI